MESPAVVLFSAVFFRGADRFAIAPLALLALWQLHYVNRTLVYPFRIRASGKRTAIVVVAMGFIFNAINAWLNARWISELASYAPSWLYDPRFLIGVALFLVGRRINTRADATLIALRKSSGDGYGIPRGGLYRFVSCPNYLGELIEWTGWAIATWSLAGVAFAVFTAGNLVPRAVAHHRWYRQQFDDYPPERKAIIPAVL
jgi:steroid 5-alpha reductase family enzyme